MSRGFKVVGALTVLSFITMVLFSISSPGLTVGALKIQVEGKFDVTSLSITAIIMILYNLVSWVTLVQNMRNGDQVEQEEAEIERAKILLRPMDEVTTITSTISNAISGSESKEDEEETLMKKEDSSQINKHNLHGTKIEIYQEMS